MTQRRPPLHSERLRRSAEGRACTLRFVGHCNGRTDTTVLAHLYFGPKATSGKGDDLNACYACLGCHTALDGYKVRGEERYEAMARGHAETITLMLDAGMIEVCDVPADIGIPISEQRQSVTRHKPRTVARVGGGRAKRESPTATPAKILAQKRGREAA